MPAAGFVSEITLRNREVARPQNLDRQPLNQKLPLNLATSFVFHSILKCCQPYLSEKDRACNHRNIFRGGMRVV